MQFNTLGLSQPLLRAIDAAGYETPTEIQARAIPPALAGDDLIGRAKTGSGKTAAFILPTIDRIVDGPRPSRGVVRALVLTPTRELAQQVSDSARVYGRFTKLSSDAFYGGVSIEPQLKRLKRGVDILAATPGRLIDHLERGSVDLSQCEVLIVDEADRMFDMGFINDVKRIIARIPKQRQTLLFSATISEEVRRLTASIMNEPVMVEVGVEGNPAESVRQHFFAVEKPAKLGLLFHLIQEKKMESVLVFSRTKHGANKIARRLERSGIGTGILHSNRTQSQRLSALAGFRDGRYRVLVATDIAARGIDVAGISHVINYDTPTFAEDYVHRIGRTGRADATGDAIPFVAGDERDYLRKIERFVGKRYDVEAAPKTGEIPVAPEEPKTPAAAPSRNGKQNRQGNRPKHAPAARSHGGKRRVNNKNRGGDRRNDYPDFVYPVDFDARDAKQEKSTPKGRKQVRSGRDIDNGTALVRGTDGPGGKRNYGKKHASAQDNDRTGKRSFPKRGGAKKRQGGAGDGKARRRDPRFA